jgi:predicted AlkP superfamily pyrophosphatase or phosphodiesterase
MRKYLFAAAALLCACRSDAQAPAAPLAPGAPKLLVVISVDQLSGDLFDEYRPHFTGGLARLAAGAAFRNGYQSHATTETCLGHSTILTGDHPARTGIVGNQWFDAKAPRTDKTIYCAEDESAPGTNSSNYKVSPKHLRVATLGDLLKRQSPASLNVAVAGKDRSAVMMSGHSADQRWYPSGASFVTDLERAAVPQSVTRTNAVLAQVLASARAPLDPPPLCAGKAQVFPIAGGGKPVGNGRFERKAGDGGAFRASPESDGAVLALAAALIQEMRLGADASPDVLSIGLAATDYVGHTYGTGGQEMCLQLLALDRELGDFLGRLDSWGIDYAVALTADHGGLDIPERLRAKGVAGAAWIDPALSPERLGQQIAAGTKLKGPVIVFGGPSGDIFLDPALSAADRARARDALLAAYRAHPQVEAVFTKEEIGRTGVPSGSPAGWSLIQRVRASFDPERSGDLYVVLKPHIQPISDTSRYVATHGSPWDYDRRVPMLFWRRGMSAAPSDSAVDTVDIMPTIAAMIGLALAPGSVDGRCLVTVAACPSAEPGGGQRGRR